MNKKVIMPIIIIGVIALIIIVAFNNKTSAPEAGVAGNNDRNRVIDNTTPTVTENNKEQAVKEFAMDSFYEIVDGQPKPQYSLKKIIVNKGDLVRIKITVTKGMHDFKIDEYNVYADTQPNQEFVVEFTADKAGEFIYYCTKPGHRANGHWGTLKVLDN